MCIQIQLTCPGCATAVSTPRFWQCNDPQRSLDEDPTSGTNKYHPITSSSRPLDKAERAAFDCDTPGCSLNPAAMTQFNEYLRAEMAAQTRRRGLGSRPANVGVGGQGVGLFGTGSEGRGWFAGADGAGNGGGGWRPGGGPGDFGSPGGGGVGVGVSMGFLMPACQHDGSCPEDCNGGCAGISSQSTALAIREG